jgi:NAD(P)-dependent dehydrogenase (short-subunit alcohol dehydrogenase family)
MKRGGAIVNTGSVTGIMGNKNLLDYSTTKGGIHAFTRCRAISFHAGFGSMRWRPARCGRR